MGEDFDRGTRFVYILACSDKTLYTGVTKHLQQRFVEHESGKGGRYTKGRRPVSLVWVMQLPKEEAYKMERKIKRMSRAQKLKMIERQERY